MVSFGLVVCFTLTLIDNHVSDHLVVSSSCQCSTGSQVTLLANEERLRISKIMSTHFAKISSDTATAAVTSEKSLSHGQDEQPKRSNRRRSKSPHRLSLSNKSPGKAKGVPKSHFTIDGSAANHISSALLTEIMRDNNGSTSIVQQVDDIDKRPFLTTLDYLDTLSDLVLAVPACGAAIHRYKPQASLKEFGHAVCGCPTPPQNAVSFILHRILPQPRESSTSIADSDKALKLQAYNRTKLSQVSMFLPMNMRWDSLIECSHSQYLIA